MPIVRTLSESLLLGLPERPADPGACWEWKWARSRYGYGVIVRRADGRRVHHGAHRVAYEHFVGPIPDGMEVRHSCHNPPCCNPNHLSTGTHADNMRDRTLADRTKRGEAQGHAKLTESAVLDIRKKWPRETQRKLAAEYGVSASTIHKITTRQTWTHI